MMKICRKLIIFAVIFLFFAAPSQAQLFKKGVKIGYIDIAKAFDEYKRTDIATEDLKKEIEEKKQDIEKKKDAINFLKKKLDTQGVVTNEKEKTKMEEEVEAKINELKDITEKFNIDLRKKENQFVRNILEDIKEAIQSYGKDNGYDLILDKREILYGPEGMDITNEIIEIVNKKIKDK